jgi:glycosyltransferase involved in cell wall biosynthesis
LLVVTSMFPRWADDSEPGFVFELCRRLAAEFEVRVLAPHAKGAAATETMDAVDIVRYRYASERFETLAYDGGIMPKLRRNRWKWLLVPLLLVAQYRAVRRQLKHWRPDAVHAHWIIPQGTIAALACRGHRRPRLIVTAHGGDLFALKGWLLDRIKRWVLAHAQVVTVVGLAMRDVIRTLCDDDGKVHVEPMGVDLLERFTPAVASARATNEILFVGRLVENKGVNFLLDAMPLILAHRPDSKLTIAGFGPEESALRAQAAALSIQDQVAFVGPIPHRALPDLYRRASVCVAPFVTTKSGVEEGFGLVVVEAIGCECPVVVSAVSAVGDILGDQTQGLVEPGDPAALAEVVLQTLKEPHVAAERAAVLRRNALERFDWAAAASRYARLIQGAM